MNNLKTWLFIFPFVISLGLVLLLTPPVKIILTRLGLVDKPSARRINKKPIPRGGGVALFVGLYGTGLLWFATTGKYAPWTSPEQFKMYAWAALLLFVVGLIDDAFDLKPILKLVGQIAVASMIYISDISINKAIWFDLPPVVDYMLTLAWFIIIINAFNLIDGMDGLAAGLAVIGSFGLGVCLFSRGQYANVVPLAILCGGCLGFLRYNFNPATVFLGDCGSMSIGLVLATIPLLTGGKSAFLASVGVPLLIMGVPLFDTVLAIWRRSMRALVPDSLGKHDFSRVMRPDMEHLHHRFLSMGLDQRRAAWMLYLLSLVLVATAVGVSLFSNRSTGIILAGTFVIIVIMVRHLSRVELWDTGRAFMSLSQAPNFSRLLVPIYVFADILILLLSWIVSFKIAFPFKYSMHLLSVFPLFLTSTMLMMLLSGVYQRVWNRADARDNAALLISVFMGWCLGFALTIIFDLRYKGFNRQVLAFLFISGLPILLLRIARLLVSHAMSTAETMRLSCNPDAKRYLVYGAGERFSMLDTSIHGSLLGNRNGYIVAVIDDNPHLRGRIVRGQKIVGSIEDIDSVIATYRPDVLLVAASLPLAKCRKAYSAAKKHNLLFFIWRCGISSFNLPQDEKLLSTEYKEK